MSGSREDELISRVYQLDLRLQNLETIFSNLQQSLAKELLSTRDLVRQQHTDLLSHLSTLNGLHRTSLSGEQTSTSASSSSTTSTTGGNATNNNSSANKNANNSPATASSRPGAASAPAGSGGGASKRHSSASGVNVAQQQQTANNSAMQFVQSPGFAIFEELRDPNGQMRRIDMHSQHGHGQTQPQHPQQQRHVPPLQHSQHSQHSQQQQQQHHHHHQQQQQQPQQAQQQAQSSSNQQSSQQLKNRKRDLRDDDDEGFPKLQSANFLQYYKHYQAMSALLPDLRNKYKVHKRIPHYKSFLRKKNIANLVDKLVMDPEIMVGDIDTCCRMLDEFSRLAEVPPSRLADSSFDVSVVRVKNWLEARASGGGGGERYLTNGDN